MVLGLTAAALGVLMLAAFVVLFRYEERRGQRVVLTSVRLWFDRVVVAGSTICGRMFSFLGFTLLHTILYTLLRFVSRALLWLIAYVEKRMHRSQRMVQAPPQTRTDVHEESYFNTLTSHKEAVSLSDAEKRKRWRH